MSRHQALRPQVPVPPSRSTVKNALQDPQQQPLSQDRRLAAETSSTSLRCLSCQEHRVLPQRRSFMHTYRPAQIYCAPMRRCWQGLARLTQLRQTQCQGGLQASSTLRPRATQLKLCWPLVNVTHAPSAKVRNLTSLQCSAGTKWAAADAAPAATAQEALPQRTKHPREGFPGGSQSSRRYLSIYIYNTINKILIYLRWGLGPTTDGLSLLQASPCRAAAQVCLKAASLLVACLSLLQVRTQNKHAVEVTSHTFRNYPCRRHV